MKFIVVLSFCFCLLASFTAAHADKRASFWVNSADITVIDGDTLYAGGQVIQLSGIDAPEVGQQCDHNGHLWSCGMIAALDLKKSLTMARPAQLHCWIISKTSVWISATCYAGDRDLAAAMLGAGTAIATREASLHYLNVMEHAKNAELGIWGSDFENPKSWAEKVRFSNDRSACVVKAFTDQDGQKKFATPVMRSYKKAVASKQYCSDEGALLEDHLPDIKK